MFRAGNMIVMPTICSRGGASPSLAEGDFVAGLVDAHRESLVCFKDGGRSCQSSTSACFVFIPFLHHQDMLRSSRFFRAFVPVIFLSWHTKTSAAS